MLHRSAAGFVLLAILLWGDLLFFLLHLLHTSTGVAQHPSFSIAQERGYAEIYQYVKEGWIAFGYLLLDDWFMLHERTDSFLARALNLQPLGSLRPQAVAQLLFATALALVFLPAAGIAYWKSSQQDRAIAFRLAFLTGIFFFFAIGVDLLHDATSINALGFVEDGGEMITLSILAWFMLRVGWKPTPPLRGFEDACELTL